MTGYANARADYPGGTLNCELRSVNSRYLDISFRIPDELRSIEQTLRERLTGAIVRGKAEWRVSFQRDAGTADSSPDLAALARLRDWQQVVRSVMHDAALLSVADSLRWPGVIRGLDDAASAGSLAERLSPALMVAADQCLADFKAARLREGERLGQHLLERTAAIRRLAAGLADDLPALRAAAQARLAARLTEALAPATASGVMTREEIAARLQAEAAALGMRADVDEELSRLATHLDEVERVVTSSPGTTGCGKRLDFLMQELHREANTLGSKALSTQVADASLEMKLLIEQMREQVQNIE
ncbi:YicC family protein [soil metagenome]